MVTMRSFTAGAVVALLGSVAAAAPLDVVDTLRAAAVDSLHTDGSDTVQGATADSGALQGHKGYDIPSKAVIKVDGKWDLFVDNWKEDRRDATSSYVSGGNDYGDYDFDTREKGDGYLLYMVLDPREYWRSTRYLAAHNSFPSDTYGSGQHSVRVIGHEDASKASYWAWVDHPAKGGKALQLVKNLAASGAYTSGWYLAVGPYVKDSFDLRVYFVVTDDASKAASVEVSSG